MKILVFILSLTFIGCSSMSFKPLDHNLDNPKVGIEVSAGVGEEFFVWERMLGTFNIDGSIMNGSADRFDLKIKSVSKNKIALDYSEYFKSPVSSSGTYDKDAAWMIKSSFNKTLEFDLSESKKVTYKNFEFEITKIEPNRVNYKRIK